MEYSIKQIVDICKAESYGNADVVIHYLLTDSRSLMQAEHTLFFAISGLHHDGHSYIEELYRSGVRAFVVTELPEKKPADAVFIQVEDSVSALQLIAADYRSRFDIPVVAIGGSNGKTIVKEWLHQILSPHLNVVRSPKSYNSQIGVPLSVSLIRKDADVAVFEAGISMLDEMVKLESVLQPTLGVFTSLGQAHQENFSGLREKLREKVKLFESVKILVYPADINCFKDVLFDVFPQFSGKLISWSFSKEADAQCSVEEKNQSSVIQIAMDDKRYKFEIPFRDKASVENAVSVFLIALQIGVDATLIQNGISDLEPVAMRLDVRQAINDCIVINDTYNSDINSFQIALDFAEKQGGDLVVVLSDIVQSGEEDKILYANLAKMIEAKPIEFIGIGERISTQRHFFPHSTQFFNSTKVFLESHVWLDFKNKVILLKGARKFHFEDISARLELKAHQTVLEVHLDAIKHNLNYFRSKISADTKLMVMVKAFSYGSGHVEVARYLQHQAVDYLGVAFADEGVELRKAGISLPIIVMNPQVSDYNQVLDYNLQLEVYSLSQLRQIKTLVAARGISHFPIHLKLDTGMHRLGIQRHEVSDCIDILEKGNEINVVSIFSHLAASDMPSEDDFTQQQLKVYDEMYNAIASALKYKPVRHIANTHAVLRHPEAQLDMVRLGIGLYGFSSVDAEHLKRVSVLKSRVLSVKSVKADETVGYNRRGRLKQDSLIAVVPIGYADGLNRKLGNGHWEMNIRGNMYPIVGDVCMDMCMLDVTGSDVSVGDEVIIFGENPTADAMAKKLDTIVYEVLTGIPIRVKRIYTEHS